MYPVAPASARVIDLTKRKDELAEWSPAAKDMCSHLNGLANQLERDMKFPPRPDRLAKIIEAMAEIATLALALRTEAKAAAKAFSPPQRS